MNYLESKVMQTLMSKSRNGIIDKRDFDVTIGYFRLSHKDSSEIIRDFERQKMIAVKGHGKNGIKIKILGKTF